MIPHQGMNAISSVWHFGMQSTPFPSLPGGSCGETVCSIMPCGRSCIWYVAVIVLGSTAPEKMTCMSCFLHASRATTRCSPVSSEWWPWTRQCKEKN